MTMYVRALQPVTTSFSGDGGAEYHLDRRAAFQVLPLWVAQLSGFQRLWTNHVVQVATDSAFTSIITSIPDTELGGGGGGGGAVDWAAITSKPSTFPPTIGATSSTAVAGNDARLTNARTPSDGSVTFAKFDAATVVTSTETLTANHDDATVPTTQAVKTYVDASIPTPVLSDIGAGSNIAVDSTNPTQPVISVVGLTTDDIDDLGTVGTAVAQASTQSGARSALGLGSLSTLSAVDADTASVSNLELDNFKGTAVVTATETIAANNNDTTVPTSAAVKAYADSIVGGGGGGGTTPTGGRYAATIGNGSLSTIVVTHNLGTREVEISVYDATTYEEVNCDKFRTTTNAVTLTFASPPATNSLIALVTAGGSSSYITAHADHFTLQDPTDPTKQVVFSLSGITSGQTRTLTVPDSNITLGAGGGGGGDASTNTSTSVDSEVALFSGTAGKTLKRATGSGMAKLTSGVLGTGTAGTDYVAPGGALGTPSSGTLTNCTFPTLNQNTTGSAATLTTSRNIDGQAFNGSADITVIAPGTHAATSKATPVDADELSLVDSAASNVLKKLTWANLKATLKTYFDSLATTLQNKTLDNTNVVTVKDNSFTLQDNGDTTKQVVFELSGIATGTTRTITIPDTSFTIPTSGGSGGGDASTNTSTSVDSEVALFSGTGGKTLKRASGSGLALLTSGVLSTVTAPSGTIVGTTDAQIMTNKAVQPRVGTISSSATPTINLDNYDLVKLITLGTNVTNMSTNLSGTFYAGQKVLWKIKDDGTARTIAWGTSFQSSGIATLLATTVVSKTHYMLTVYDSDASKHVCLAVDPIGY